MTVKISSRLLERECIKFICSGKPSGKKLLSLIDESYFGSKLDSLVYKRIIKLMRKNGEIVSWRSLQTDSALPDAVRESLLGFKKKVVINKQRMEEIYGQLNTYRKRRIIFELTKYANEKQLAGGYEEDVLIDEIAQKLSNARTKKIDDDPLVFGVGANYKKVMERVKSGEALKTIPIGFDQWDRVNGGLASKSVTLITGFTGSMKSTLSDVISCNLADQGARVGQISLEMSQEEIAIMRSARIARIDRTEILQAKNITKKQWDKIDEGLARQSRKWKKLNATVRTHTPKNLHKDDLFIFLELLQYDVVVLDYASLLRGVMDSDNFWKMLMEIMSTSKVFANANNCRMIILAQSDEDGKLKLSKNMMNDADVVFVIKHDPSNEDIMEVLNPKARKQKPTTLLLKKEGAYANITDLPEEERLNFDRKKVKNDFKPTKDAIRTKSGKTQEDLDVDHFLGEDVDID